MDFAGLALALVVVVPWVGFITFAVWCVAKVTAYQIRVDEQRNATKAMFGNQVHSAVSSVRMDQDDCTELEQYRNFADRFWDLLAPGTPYGTRSLNQLEQLLRRGLVRPNSLIFNEGQLQFDNSVVIPASIVDNLGLKAGDFVYFVNRADGVVMVVRRECIDSELVETKP